VQKRRDGKAGDEAVSAQQSVSERHASSWMSFQVPTTLPFPSGGEESPPVGATHTRFPFV
jgi:hypothetical protein